MSIELARPREATHVQIELFVPSHKDLKLPFEIRFSVDDAVTPVVVKEPGGVIQLIPLKQRSGTEQTRIRIGSERSFVPAGVNEANRAIRQSVRLESIVYKSD